MVATLLKILPVLWPYFKEMILGGKKETGEEKSPRLKALFYVIMLLVILIGYGSYHGWLLLNRLHEAETANAKILGNLENNDDTYKSLKDDLVAEKSENKELNKRINELRDKEVSLSSELATAKAQATEYKNDSEELKERLKEAIDASDKLSKFNTTKQSPNKLKQHNKAVDTLHQLQEEVKNGEI